MSTEHDAEFKTGVSLTMDLFAGCYDNGSLND